MKISITYHGNVCKRKEYELPENTIVTLCENLTEDGMTAMLHKSGCTGIAFKIRSVGMFEDADGVTHSMLMKNDESYRKAKELIDIWIENPNV